MSASSMVRPDDDEHVTVTAYPVDQGRAHIVLHSDAGFTTWVLNGQQFEALRGVLNEFAATGYNAIRYANVLFPDEPVTVRAAGKGAVA